MKAKWEDCSSYSRGERLEAVEPKTVTLHNPYFKLIVTRHIHYPGKWLRLFDGRETVLDSETLEGAKMESENAIREYFESCLDVIR